MKGIQQSHGKNSNSGILIFFKFKFRPREFLNYIFHGIFVQYNTKFVIVVNK